ncbi:MAG TPA: hypothetical protein ENN46_01475, partial [Candidatus Woesearchaeota archaeon]|nr:hypothetical protein [Candidatus Woesearchaeota archaeon]
YIRDGGVAIEACFPYQAKEISCSEKCVNWMQDAWRFVSYTYQSGSPEKIISLIQEKGPLVTSMDVYRDFYYYKSGIYNVTSTDFLGRHAVLIVGYNYDNDSNLYWIVKNSWGTGWGEKGFFNIYAGVSGIGRAIYHLEIPFAPYDELRVCEDLDNDGYCNWGLGEKPASCPSFCKDLMDCDDSNPQLALKC